MANLIPGAPIKLGGRTFIVPALSFGQLKVLRNEFKITEGAREMTDEITNAVVKIAHAAISRNYPTITILEMEELIDMRNVHDLLPAIKGESGFVTNVEPVDDATGEIKPGA